MKKKLISKTIEIIQNEGIEEAKARRIASEVGCTSTTIYRHFDSLDHLLTFASIKFLERYIADFTRLVNEDDNELTRHIKLWKSFAQDAFHYVPSYELLFWGDYSDQTGEMIYEYYQMFKKETSSIDAIAATVLFNGNLRERELTMMRHAASMGYISRDDIDSLIELEVCLFQGKLHEYRELYKEEGKAEEGASLFIDIIENLTRKYWKIPQSR